MSVMDPKTIPPNIFQKRAGGKKQNIVGSPKFDFGKRGSFQSPL